MIPYPDPIVISLLAGLPGITEVEGRVGTSLKLVEGLPAIRITKVGDYEAPSAWEATPLYQVEVWSDSEFQSGSISWAIKHNWPTATKQIVGDAAVHGRWVEVNPNPSHDTETETSRHILTVGIRLSGAAS